MNDIYEDLKRWGDCGTAARAYREHGCTSHAQAWDWLCASDQHEWLVWLALRTVSRESLCAFIHDVAHRAITTAAITSKNKEWRKWAQGWLSGEDRSRASALAAHSVSDTTQAEWAEYIAEWSTAKPSLATADGVAYAATRAMGYGERKNQADFWRTQPNPFNEPTDTSELPE